MQGLPPHSSSASIENLKRRSKLLQRLRAFFDTRGFLEVQTPVISQNMVIDRHLDPLIVVPFKQELAQPNSTNSISASRSMRFMQTSPELQMKRLLSGGLSSIYQVGPVFRAGEIGEYHNPEFTMAEWYRVGDDYDAGMKLTEELLRELLRCPPADRLTYQSAFEMTTRLRPLECPTAALVEFALGHRCVDSPHWSDDRDDWLNLIFSHFVQPELGHDRPAFVTHFPASQSALAVISREDDRTAERFELFYRGIELANGYHELTDVEVLRQRDTIANDQRAVDGKLELPVPELLYAAMQAGIPACTGCALGFDRVVMIASGSQSLADVICFPWDRA